jgi:hypothetical protein
MTRLLHQDGSHRKRHIDSLKGLNLSAEDWAAVVRHGTVCAEYRRGGGPYYKLRFRRCGGKQAVRYLGKDRRRAVAIQNELHALRQPRQQVRALQRLDVQARRLLRQTKRALIKDVQAIGYDFHGHQIRKRRSMAKQEHQDVQHGSNNLHPEPKETDL